MSNYVWSKIICSQEVFDKIVMDSPTNPSHSIISFHKILDVDYDDREARNVLVVKNADDTYELKYCQRWFYPITCITRLIETFHDVIWYLVEENHIYVSKFYWDNGVKEDIMDIEYQYYDWLDENPIFGDALISQMMTYGISSKHFKKNGLIGKVMIILQDILTLLLTMLTIHLRVDLSFLY